MILTANPSYLTAAQFKAQANDQDLSSYTDAQLQDILNRASGAADSIMRRSLIARERTIRYLGDGSNKLELRESPVLYIKRLQTVVPGSTGSFIPANQLLIDAQSGSVVNYTPVYLMQGIGYYAMFPAGVAIDVTLGYGFGYNPFTAPAYTTADSSGVGIAAGAYNLAVTTKTMFGETTASVKQVTTSTGSILVSPAATLGSYVYRAYISSAANNTTVSGSIAAGATSFTVANAHSIAIGDVLLIGSGATAEYVTVLGVSGTTLTTSAFANAHSNGEAVIEQPKLCAESPFTAYGPTGQQFTIASLTPQNGIWQDVFPLTDTAAPVLPQAIAEAVRLLAISIIWEQNNLANRGVNLQVSKDKRVAWRPTDGNSAKGVSSFVQQADVLLSPYKFSGMF